MQPIAQIPSVMMIGNQMQLTFQCDQAGSIYFAINLQTSAFTPSFQEIKSKTQQGKLKEVPRDEKDPYWTSYGYNYAVKNVDSISTIQNIKMNSLYSLDYYCVNNDGIVSIVQTKRNIKTPDNQSRLNILTFLFDKKLTSDQQV